MPGDFPEDPERDRKVVDINEAREAYNKKQKDAEDKRQRFLAELEKKGITPEQAWEEEMKRVGEEAEIVRQEAERNALRDHWALMVAIGRNNLVRNIERELKIEEDELKKDPNNPKVLKGLAALYRARGDMEKGDLGMAIAYMRRYLENSPTDTRMLVELAKAYQENGSTGEAIKVYKDLIGSGEEVGLEAKFNLALLLSEQNPEQALRQLEEIRQIPPRARIRIDTETLNREIRRIRESRGEESSNVIEFPPGSKSDT